VFPTYTPLRYPGGKTKLGPYLAAVLKANRLVDSAFAEPYAGGAGAALFLLFRGYASDVCLNDIDPAVISFWKSLRDENERFARRIERTPLTIREWDKQKEIFRNAVQGFDLAFAFFYLNRTNRSGIMNAGVIGGREQRGRWGIDARFNRVDLARRVRNLAPFRRRISITRSDALTFLASLAEPRRKTLFVYLDPPYFQKGRDLYTSSYDADDHAQIAKYLRTFRRPWLLTYDDCEEIRRLYQSHQVLDSELSYSAREVRRGREVVVLGPRLRQPSPLPRPRGHQPGFAVVAQSATDV
jgi:DNA adenine methylase